MIDWIYAIPLISAVIGYVTNWVAIRMLFRPHGEKRLLGVRLPFTPGLIPRRRQEIGGSIGRSVSRYLVTGEAIGARLQQPAFRQQLDGVVEGLTERWLRRELPSVNALIPEAFASEWGGWVAEGKARAAGWIESLLAGRAFGELIERQTEAQLRRWLDTPLEDLVPPDVLDRAPERLSEAIRRLLDDEGLESRIGQFLQRRLHTLSDRERPLDDLLPPGLKAVFYEKLNDVVPYILDRLVLVLEDERVRKRIKIVLFELVDDLLNRQFKEDSVWDQFKLGLMESFVISPDEIKQRIEDGVDQAGPRIAELVRQDDVRAKVHQALVDSIERFLNKRLGEFNLGEQTLDDLQARLSRWAIALLRSEGLREQLTRWLEEAVASRRGQSLRTLLPGVSDDALGSGARRLATRVLAWARSAAVRQPLAAFVSEQADGLLSRPLGRLDRFMPEAALQRAQALLAERLVGVLVRETPVILQRLDIERLVAEQVDGFSLVEVENLILGITGRQLKAITWFGAVLGFAIGLFQLLILVLQR